jgi:hypothetical protein
MKLVLTSTASQGVEVVKIGKTTESDKGGDRIMVVTSAQIA